VYRTEVI